jgi:Cupredoxin-like domain
MRLARPIGGLAAAILFAALGAVLPALADDVTKVEVTIKDHKFSPSEIHVPASRPAVLVVRNEDATPEEIDSRQLKVEKVIAGGKEVTIHLRPLAQGRYPFAGEYHSDTAQGVVVAE